MNPNQPTTPVATSTSAGLNGYTANTQNQFGASGGEVALATASTNKGGMRGFGLLAMVIAEIALKKKALDLAKDYYKTNKRDYDFFKTSHQGPMADSVKEAFGPLNPQYNYDLYSSVPAGIAKAGIIDRQWFEARRRMPKYNVGQQRRLDYEMSVARVSAVMAGWNIATRFEYNYADERNNRALDKKVAIANVGIGVGNIVKQGLSSAVSNLATSYDNVGDTIASIGNGYAAKQGYEAGRAYVKERFNDATRGAQ